MQKVIFWEDSRGHFSRRVKGAEGPRINLSPEGKGKEGRKRGRGLGGNSIGFLDRLTDRLKMGDGLKMSDFGLGMS